MAKPFETYQPLKVESFTPASTANRHGTVHIRPLPEQGVDTGLYVSCSKLLSNTALYPVGTQFQIKAKVTDREGTDYIYSPPMAKFLVLGRPK